MDSDPRSIPFIDSDPDLHSEYGSRRETLKKKKLKKQGKFYHCNFNKKNLKTNSITNRSKNPMAGADGGPITAKSHRSFAGSG